MLPLESDWLVDLVLVVFLFDLPQAVYLAAQAAYPTCSPLALTNAMDVPSWSLRMCQNVSELHA
ncbi:MAG: hypothetical protein ABS39_01680 [Acidovorax sp. SCN 65-28]|nr:MAG: hypothetical protein ABS39_01680 [Acidovorax sp. SCN 65-28]OJU05509.1 MAG: hypothetical protein BGN90_07545 [Acidovorax sp. 65-7]